MAGTIKPSCLIWKDWGETPLEALTRLRLDESIPDDVPMTYAGRLDPAAEGYLMILTGEECKKKEEYTKLPKTYMAEIVFGVATDSFDLLGVPQVSQQAGEVNIKNIQNFLDALVGESSQKYPPYSSKTVDGKQLHAHTKEGSEVELPEHTVELFSYEDLNLEDVKSEDLFTRVGEITSLVTGNFRQSEIVQAWSETNLPEKLQLISITLNVGSGFYVRQFAEDLGKYLGTGACLYSLIRTKIGE